MPRAKRMDWRNLSKIEKLLAARLDRLVMEVFPEQRPVVRGAGPTTFLSSIGRNRVEKEWTGLCLELGIARMEEVLEEARAFEDLVVVHDPMPGGEWLEMSHDTALKLLTLGIP